MSTSAQPASANTPAVVPIQLVVGLGNPGREYEATRHNAGAWFLDRLMAAYPSTLSLQAKLKAALGRVTVADQLIWLARPTTYMNESGAAVGAIARFYKIAPEAILVVHDELDFEVGTVRLKVGGGHGQHNGLRSIITELGSSDFVRLRLGIGHPGHKSRVHDYVLTQPPRHDLLKMREALDEAIAVLPDIVRGDRAAAMRYLHS